MPTWQQPHWVPKPVVGGFRFLTRSGWFPVIAAGLSLVALWLFVELAEDVREHDTRAFDEALFKTIGGQYDRFSGFWQEAGRDLTALGGVTVITLITAFVTLFLALKRQWKGALFVAISVAGGLAISLALKAYFDRDRPDLFPHRSIVHTSSFPSGHSANSAVAYFTMAVLMSRLLASRAMKAYVFAVGLLIPALVGLSRVFLGVHWPTDVLAGWLIGLSWGLLVYGVASFLQAKGAIEPEGAVEQPALANPS